MEVLNDNVERLLLGRHRRRRRPHRQHAGLGTAALRTQVRKGNIEGGTARFMDDLNGAGAWLRMPRSVQESMIQNVWTYRWRLPSTALRCSRYLRARLKTRSVGVRRRRATRFAAVQGRARKGQVARSRAATDRVFPKTLLTRRKIAFRIRESTTAAIVPG